MAKSILTAHQLRELLFYDQDTGLLTWKKTGTGRNKEKISGYLGSQGYRRVMIFGVEYAAHRLAWLHSHGEWPNQIDHINGIRSDNRLLNLRDVDCTINNQNQRKAQKRNKTGVLGVKRRGNKFQSRIRINGKDTHLGTFATLEMAGEAYVKAKRVAHEGCTI